MDFFGRQDEAKRKTTVLVVYFIIAVVLTILSVYLATAFSIQIYQANAPVRYSRNYADPNSPGAFIGVLTDGLPWFDKDLFFLVTGSVLLVVFLGSSIMTFRLSQGGKSVASLLGGRPLNPSTTKPDEIKLRNVVEEMAIASGLPMPEIYLLNDEAGINAFAAGYTSSDAVIGVTRGCLQILSRDELQGVIAHEFSHILNGDMRLNMRLSCLSFGILFIAETGKFLIEIAFRTPRTSSKKEGGQLILLMGLAGLILTVVGSIGYFFTSALKAAICRQREFLADAASVQFTRNPAGIGGALKKIGGFTKGSTLDAPQATQAGHFLFSPATHFLLGELLSTHPPLVARILAVDPHFQYEFPKVTSSYRASDYQGSLESSSELAPGASFLFQGDVSGLNRPEDVLKTVGQLQPVQIQRAAALRESFPPEVFQSAHEPFGARGLVIAALLARHGAGQTAVPDLSQTTGTALNEEIKKLFPLLHELPSHQILSLIDLCLPALRQLSPDQFKDFRGMVQTLIEEDGSISLFEYTLQKILFRHLDSFFNPKARKSNAEFNSLKQILPSILNLLGALACFDSDDDKEKEAAFQQGCRQLNLQGGPYLFPSAENCGLSGVDQSLDVLQRAVPGLKRNILYACATVVMFNSRISEEEGELLRAIADTLDCPIPPFVTTKK